MRRKKKVESYDDDGGSMSSSAAPSPVTAPDATAANTGGAAASSAPSLASRLQSASGSGHESSSAAAGNVGRWDAASGIQAGPASGTARYTAANAAEPVAAQEAAAAADTQGAQTSADQPVTWYDEGGNCWCDSPDGWRYWWDAAAQQWRQHSQLGSPAVAASAFVEPIAAAEDAAHVSKEQQDQRPSQATSQDEQPVPAAPEEQMVAAEVPVSQPVAATGAVGGPATSDAHVAGPAATQAAAAVSKPDLAGELEAAHADAPRPSAARSLGFAGTAGHAGDAARVAVEPTASGTGGLQGSGGPAPMADEAAPREELLAEPAGVRDAAPALGTAAEQPEPASAAAQRDAGATVSANAIDEAGAAGEAAAEPAATEGQAQQQGDPQTGQQAEQPVVPAEPVTWYDEGGNCWCDSPDGWRYWWDAVAQQWRQHSQFAALEADASAAAAAAHAPHEEAAVAPEQLSGGGVAAHDQQHPEQQLQLEQGRGATPLSAEQLATEQLAAAEPPAATVQAAAADDQPVEQAAVPELAPQADAPAEEQTSAVVGVALAGLPAATTPAASEEAIDAAAAQAASWAAAPPDEAQALAADESAQLAEPAWDVPELPAWNAAEAVLPPATTEPTDQDRPVRLAPAAADAALPAPSPGSVLDQPAPQARAEAGAGAAANDPEAAAVSDLGKLQAEAGAVVVGEARPAALKVEAEASPLAPPPVGGFYQQLQQGPAAAGPGSPPTLVSSPLSSPRQRLQARYVLPPAASPRATSAWAAHPPSAPAALGSASAGPLEAQRAAVVAASGSEAERAEAHPSGSKAAEAMAAPAVMPVDAAVAELAAGAAPAATVAVSAPEGQEAASPQGDRSFSPRAAEAATAIPAAGAAEPPGHDGPASSPVAAPKQPEMNSYLLPAAEQAESVAAVPTGQPEPEQEAAPPPELIDSPVCSYTSATMPLFGDAPDNEDQPWLCTSPGQAAAPPAHTPPSSARPKHLSSGSGDVGSPLAQADTGAADSGSVSQGFGSVMMLASETSSRHGSWLPGQVAAMAAAAAASDESDDAQSAPAALPSATPAAAVEGAAEGSAETDAAEDAGWDLPAEPATTFHVVSKPLFGPDGDEAAAFSDPAAAPQEEPSPSSFFEQPDYDAPAASAAQPWAAAAEPAAAQQAASWERPQPGQWTEAAAPWEEAGPAAPAAAVPWEQPEGATAAAEAPAAAAAWEQAAAPWDSAEQQVAEAPAPPDEQQAAASWPHQAAPWEQPEPKPPGPTAAAPWEQPAAPWEQEGDQQQQHKTTQPQDQPQRAEHAPAQQLPRDGHSAAPGARPWQPAAPADADAGSFFDELAAASSPAVASAATAWEQPSAAPFQTTGSSSFSEPPASQHPGTSLPAASAAPDSSAPWQAAQPAAQPWHASGTSQGQDSRPSAATAAVSLPAELQGAPAQLPVPAANDALDLDSPELGSAPASGAYSFMQQQGPGAADDFDSALQEVWSPTAADEAAAAAQQVTAATAGDDSTGRPENEPWYDEAGVCWMDGTDGWRYWWDASAQCWQQHSQVVPDSAAAQEEPGQQAAAADEQAELADVRASVLSPILEGDTPAASPAMPSLLSADWAAQPSGPSAAASDWEDSFGMAAGAQPASAPPAPEPKQYAPPPSTAAANLLAAPALAAIEQPAQEAGAAAWSQASWQSAQQAAPFAGQDSAAADDWQIVSEQEAWQAGAPQQPADQQQGPSQEQQQQQAQQQPWQPASWPEPEQAAAQPGWPHPTPQEEQQQPQPQPAGFQTFGGSQPVPGAAPLPAPSMFVPGQGPGRTASPASNTGAPAVFAAGQAASCALAGSYPGGPASYAGSSLPGALAAPPAYPSSGMAMSTSGYSLHGRPPFVFGKLLFGGRVLVAAPTGQLQLLAIAREPPLVLQPLPGAPTTSLAALLVQLESFPGPLGSGTSKDKVARFCAEQAEAAAAGASPDAQSRSTLWSVLQVMAQHQGRISSAPYSLHDPGQGGGKQASPAALPEAQLAAALLGSEGAGGAEAQHQLLLPAVASATPAAAAGAAAEVQSLLLQGRRSDAFRLALDSQLWPVALLLSRLLGEAASAAAAAAMAEQCIAEGSPLQTLLLLLGGASPERPLAAAAAAAPAAGGPSGPPYPAADRSWPQSGVFRPAASSPAGAASWRRHLAVIAANRTPGDEAAMLTLGRQLLAAGQLLPAHICFVLAGALLQPWDVVAGAAGSAGAAPSSPPLVLLGADVANPRRCSRLDCILPTEVFTWSRTVGNTALSGQYLPILPYKLLHAYALADLGLLQQASAYCAAMSTTLQALGTRVPPGLLVCRAMTAELASRVQQYAAGQKLSLGTSITTTLVSSVGKWLDRGLTAVLGGGETGEGGRHSRRASHSRNPSTSSVDTGKDAGQRFASSQGAHGRLGGTDGASSAQPEEPGRMGGIFHRVSSITSMLRPKSGTASPGPSNAPPTEPENTFYYDSELKMWRERGVEPQAPPEPLAPPPTATWQPLAETGSAAGGATPPLPPLPSGGMPAQRGAAGVSSRYALARSYGVPAAESAGSALAPSLLPQAGGLTPGQPQLWQAGSHTQAAAAGSSGFAAPAYGRSASSAPAAHEAPPAVSSTAGPPASALQFAAGGAAPASSEALAAPPSGPPNGLRIQHTRALSTDSAGSGWQPGMHFAATPGTSTPPVPHQHAPQHFHAMPYSAGQAGGGYNNVQF